MIIRGKPFFADDKCIDLTAYIGPRRAGKRLFNGKYGENPRDAKVSYPSFITDEMFILYKEAGMNFLMPEGDAWYGQNIAEDGYVEETDFLKSDLYSYMKMAEKHGLAVYPASEKIFGAMTHCEGPFGEEEKKIVRDFIETIQRNCPENFEGIMLTDEPTYRSLDRVKKIVEYLKSDEIQSIKPNLKMFASMLPIYAPLRAYHPDYTAPIYNKSFKFDKDRFDAYQYYIEKCSEAVGEFCCDFYPLQRNGYLSPGFYQNLEMVAEYAKAKNIPTAITLQSVRMDAKYNPKTGRGVEVLPIPSYEDLRFQVYSSLAFGVRRIGYFTFWQHFGESTGEIFPKAMINYEPSEEKGYRVSEIYYAVKEVNREILNTDHVFLRYKWQGCQVVRTSREKNIRLVKGGYKDGCISKAKASRDLLIGCFTHEDNGTEGYWIVNAQNPYYYEMNDVAIEFKGADKLLYYRKGKEYAVDLEKHEFKIRLGVGEGIFAIPYMDEEGEQENEGK